MHIPIHYIKCPCGVVKKVSFKRESTNHNIFLDEFARHGINTRKMGPLFIIIIIILIIQSMSVLDFFGNKGRKTVSI